LSKLRTTEFNPILAPWLCAGVVLVVLCTLGLRNEWYLVDHDMISYITIAEKYARFDLKPAINSNWSPLICWLMVPPLWLGANPVFAFKAVLLASGILTLWFVDRLAVRLQVTLAMRYVLAFGLIMLIANAAVNTLGPDLLGATVLLLYLNLCVRQPRNNRLAVLTGAVAGIAYFAKHYAALFVVLHYGLTAIIEVVRERKGRSLWAVLRPHLLVACAFVAVAGCWVALISIKYGHLTVSTAPALSLAMNDPAGQNQLQHYRVQRPPNPTAVSVWEDPTYIRVTQWSPFESGDQSAHFRKTLYTNVREMSRTLQNYFTLWYLPLLLLVLVRFIRPLQLRWNTPLQTVFLACILFPTGYFLLHFRDRFLLFMVILLVLLTMTLLSLLSSVLPKSVRILAILLAMGFAYLVSQHPFRQAWYGNSPAIRNHYFAVKELSRRLNLPGKSAVTNGDWDQGHNFCYLAGMQMFGVIDLCSNRALAFRQVLRFGPDYYLEWQDQEKCVVPDGFVEVQGTGFWNLKLYRVGRP
jgi:hypothetical protein